MTFLNFDYHEYMFDFFLLLVSTINWYANVLNLMPIV